MRRKKEGRVLGPYKERGKWRIVAVHPNGLRISVTYSSKAKALAAVPRALVELQNKLPLGDHIEPYLDILKARDLVPSTIASRRTFLRDMFAGEVAASWNSLRVEQTLELWATRWSVATRQMWLLVAQQFFDWLLAQKKVTVNPFAGIKIVGKANRGKPQLRIDEARRFTETACYLYGRGLRFALAPILAISMGLRASEITMRVVRDIDDCGKLLWVPFGKTANARRRLDVPEPLQPLLADLAAGREPLEPLFGINRVGKPWRRQDLHALVRAICRLAKVPVVCPHSLRGLWASMAVRSGAATDAVARTLGHSSFKTTARHYAKQEAIDGARTDLAGDLLFRKPSG